MKRYHVCLANVRTWNWSDTHDHTTYINLTFHENGGFHLRDNVISDSSFDFIENLSDCSGLKKKLNEVGEYENIRLREW